MGFPLSAHLAAGLPPLTTMDHVDGGEGETRRSGSPVQQAPRASRQTGNCTARTTLVLDSRPVEGGPLLRPPPSPMGQKESVRPLPVASLTH